MKRHIFLLTSALLPLLLLSSCNADLRELCYDHTHSWGSSGNVMLRLNLQLDLDLNFPVSIEAHTKILTPTYMKACFYDINDGHLVKTEYVGTYGGPVSLPPGTYDMVVYTFGTEWTQIRGESHKSTLEAFTSDITDLKAATFAAVTRGGEAGTDTDVPIIYTPDHLLVAKERIVVPVATEENQVITITSSATTILETYCFELTNVQGLQYIQTVDAFVTNQARSSFFGRGEVNPQAAIINFPVEVDRTQGIMRTTFNTFGKLPGETHSYLHIVLVSSGGDVITVSTDITDQFDNPDHEIVIDVPIDVPQPQSEGGGIAPSVDPWDEENHDVPIG